MATLATAVRNSMCDAMVDSVDAGSGAGTLKIYTGSKPATPGDAATGTLLCTFPLSDPAFGAAASGTATLDITPAVEDTSADATGTAGYARFADSDAGGKFDCSVTATGGGGEVQLNTTSIVAGAVVTVTACTVTQPAGS